MFSWVGGRSRCGCTLLVPVARPSPALQGGMSAEAAPAAADVAPPAAAEAGGVQRAHRLDASPDDQTRCARCSRMLRSRLFWAKFWLVATGVWWGVCMQLLFYQGAGHPLAQLPNIDWYIGMMLVYAGRLCSPRSAHAHYARIKLRHVLPIAICDFLGTVGTTIGLELAGSAIFGIIYSSVTVWTALFTCVILRKAQTSIKMMGIATVVAGLTLPTLDHDADSASQGRLVFVGICLTFVGTLFYALEYTLCERAFTLYDRPVDAKQLCFLTGAWGLAFTSVWMAAYTIPHWQELVVDEVAERGGNIPLIMLLFATHTVNNGVHNAAWFVVCELESGVSTGLLMGVKAAALFLASALFFCNEDHPEQCMTPSKSTATAVVLFGTAVYYWPDDVSLDCSSWLECYRLPRGASKTRRASTAPLRTAGPTSELATHAEKGEVRAVPGVAVAAVKGKPAPSQPRTERWRRRRRGGHAKLDESGYDDDEGEAEAEGEEAEAGDVEAGGVDAGGVKAVAATPGHQNGLTRNDSPPSPKMNGTPLALSTPNDECCRTPLEPTRSSSSRPPTSSSGAIGAAARVARTPSSSCRTPQPPGLQSPIE